jgi:hypothetical protein
MSVSEPSDEASKINRRHFPDNGLGRGIEWIGGVGYNSSVATDLLIDSCSAQ